MGTFLAAMRWQAKLSDNDVLTGKVVEMGSRQVISRKA